MSSTRLARSGRTAVLLPLLFCCLLETAAAQDAPQEAPEVRLLAAGWNALANGDATTAARIASELAQPPAASRNIAVLAFIIEASLAESNSRAALNAYERWLAERTVEAPYALRRISVAVLREAAFKSGSATQLAALTALARDGDAGAEAEIAAGRQGDQPALLAGAMLGHDNAVEELAKRVATRPAGQERFIAVLGESGNRRAIPHLVGLLSSPNFDTSAAAARALGLLGAREASPQLRELLDASYPAVRLAAAEALFRMGDNSGRNVLEVFAASEHAAIRVGAAEAMATRTDDAWLELVRPLTRDTDPMVRLRAARLLAPHDPDLSAEVLGLLMEHDNPAIREAAGVAVGASGTRDFALLRRVLRGTDERARVEAAGRILALTR